MKEIGGYLELEHYSGKMLHEGAIALNCGRNALAYLIKAKRIHKILLPYFVCDSVINLCKQYKMEIRYYHINGSFLPDTIEIIEDEWLYLIDFYGQLSQEDIDKICNKYEKVIIDYAQAYFKLPVRGVDSIYTCRKFFGVSDGAFLYTDAKLNEEIPVDESFDRMRFIVGRYEKTASDFYQEYIQNEKLLESLPIMRMSKLTENFLRILDYERIKKIRTANFEYLNNRLHHINLLQLRRTEGAYAYPLYLENGEEVRKRLIARKIYIPILWPNVLTDVPDTMYEHQLCKNILPLPCDQRYTETDMEYICKCIEKN